MSSSKLLITAATGNVGTPLVKALQRKNMRFTAGTRVAENARNKFGSDLETVYFDYDDPESFGPALEGKETMFLCGPSATPHAVDLIMPLIEEAKKQGLCHIVFIASYPSVMEAIKQAGIDYTFIKANFFMQNFEIYQTEDIRDRKQIFLPCGEGKAAFIHTRDIGEVSAEILTDPKPYKSETLYLTGPQALDHFEAAEVFSEVLETGITYRNPDETTYRREMKQRGFSDTYIEAMIKVFGKIKNGQTGQTSPVAEQMLNRKPLSLKDYVKERKEVFKK
ncbi:MAG: NmrA family NAD(P)-binding protein [Bacteroidales bacterium]|nr:NmrA family NAD(P)-binding protein [Bacteroidales bacterium]MCF8337368.1 NmrA family NAD(P)-binding protein [Bacteroidales bacterium]